jgi:hypothetical protein
MATTTYKVLAQSALSATTNTDVYTVPSATQTIVSTVSICNRSATAATFRLAIRPVGASIANQHYVAYDVALAGNDTANLTLGFTLGAADVVTAYASTANISVSLFGSQIA